MQKKYHLIAIGGSVMHNVAIDLKELGHKISGSDDEIYEPSKRRLNDHGLLPASMGWDVERINSGLDAVILGKHAKENNPELLRAEALNIPIFSFPEFISGNSKAKTRVCIAGSHGKTSTTAIIMHVCKYCNLEFDYLVGAQLEGFHKMVKLSNAEILICEGDEYPSSALDNRAKMLHYKANISVITGLAWDHVNIYKTYESYKEAFRDFLNTMPKRGICFYDQSDLDLNHMMINEQFLPSRQSYLAFETTNNSEVLYNGNKYPIQLFGEHNMKNLRAAYLVCLELGIEESKFFEAIENYKGASKRLELIFNSELLSIYRDFAHAPSKCEATIDAIRSKYPKKRIKAVLELHTFSSLNIEFISNYKGTMNKADEAIVYYDEHAIRRKQMPDLNADLVKRLFDHNNIHVVNESQKLESLIRESSEDGTEVLLIMSSGTLSGIELSKLF